VSLLQKHGALEHSHLRAICEPMGCEVDFAEGAFANESSQAIVAYISEFLG